MKNKKADRFKQKAFKFDVIKDKKGRKIYLIPIINLLVLKNQFVFFI